MTIITYTYPVGGSAEPVSGLTAKDVAIERLEHDGYRWEMRREPHGWQIYVSQHSANSGLGARTMNSARSGPAPHGQLLFSTAATEEDAWRELAPKVVFADWRGVPEAMTDEDYREMMAVIAAEDGEE
jgi:hypothetical protein